MDNATKNKPLPIPTPERHEKPIVDGGRGVVPLGKIVPIGHGREAGQQSLQAIGVLLGFVENEEGKIIFTVEINPAVFAITRGIELSANEDVPIRVGGC